MLRVPTTNLQVLAIVSWFASIVVNPEVDRKFGPGTWAMLLALICVCTWRGATPSVQAWRAGTILYGLVLTLAFWMELNMMRSQSELFTLPLAILISLGFTGVVALRRDYVLIVAMIWSILLTGRPRILPEGMDTGLVAIMITTTVLVSLGLNHVVVVNLRTTFALKEDFRHLSETDTLTELPNRRCLTAQLEMACAESARDQWHFALLDLDDFKSVNDRFGHDAGDEVLVALAGALRRLPDGFAVGRLGGEEFGILVRGISRDTMQAILQQLLEEVRELRVRGTSFSFSVGFVRIQPSEQVIEVLRRADAALYAAKHDGKARVAWGWERQNP